MRRAAWAVVTWAFLAALAAALGSILAAGPAQAEARGQCQGSQAWYGSCQAGSGGSQAGAGSGSGSRSGGGASGGGGSGGGGSGVGISVTPGGLVSCPGVQVSAGGTTVIPWVFGSCPPVAATPAPSPARTPAASTHPRAPVPETTVPVPAPATAPAAGTAAAAGTAVAPAAHASRGRKASGHPARSVAKTVFFRPALAQPAATTYRPGQPVMPIGMLMTVVLTPCVITVAARLGKLLCGR